MALGLPDGMLGTAWPSMRDSLHVPVGDLGLVLLAYTVGAVGISAVVGRLIRRTGVAPLLAASGLVAAGASAAFSVAPVLGVVLLAGVGFGVAGGTMDGGLNIAVGMSGRSRLLNLLHGFYGIGTMIGPLVVTAAVVSGSWRPAYLVLLAVDAVLAVSWLAARPPVAVGPDAGEPAAEGGAPGRPALTAVTGIAVFFVYTGLEAGAGQWETTFGRDHLHLSAAAAGLATFGYWTALTVVRLGLGVLPRRPGHQTVVRAGTGLAVAAAAVIWWEPSGAAAVVGFVVLGGALAGVFPALIALTPARVGQAWAPRLIAWQIGAASAGGAALSAVIGVLVDGSGLAVLGPSLTVLAVVLVGLEALLRRLAPNRRSSYGVP